ncbi:MAG: hypothetical protein JNK58_02320, partial [Phycisphaerae bacterium]|nr:hypothetical protein [Phycisphaerae bacterium]
SAVNAVTATLGAARTRAVKSGHRAGVAFLWDMKEERMTLQLIEQSGSSSGSLTNQVTMPCPRSPAGGYAEIFVPAVGIAPVELPKGMGVFGLSSAMETGACETGQPLVTLPERMWRWYAGDVINGGNDLPEDDLYLWIFPRNDPRIFTERELNGSIGVDPWQHLRGITTNPPLTNSAAIEAVRNVTSFFVVFSPDGSITTSRRTGSSDYFDAFLELTDAPINPQMPASQPYDDEYRFDPENFNGLPQDQRAANPEVVLRSADQLAVVDLSKLSDGVGLPKAWLVRPTQSRAPKPAYLMSARYFDDANARAVSRWIDINGEVLSFNRYSGHVIRRSSQ